MVRSFCKLVVITAKLMTLTVLEIVHLMQLLSSTM